LATPAPSSALLAVAGMPVLGLAWMVRRRRSKVDGAAAIA
jgi:MYXO-CTERM domain-containing protein